MASKPRLQSIPVPLLGNAQSVHDTLMAMKQAVEEMLGETGNAPVSRTFIQEATPTAIVVGDLWIQPSTTRISYWDGRGWRLTTIGA